MPGFGFRFAGGGRCSRRDEALLETIDKILATREGGTTRADSRIEEGLQVFFDLSRTSQQPRGEESKVPGGGRQEVSRMACRTRRFSC